MRSPEEGRQRERKDKSRKGVLSGEVRATLPTKSPFLPFLQNESSTRTGTAASANQTSGDATSNSSHLFQKAKAKHERIPFTNKHSNKKEKARTLTYILRQGKKTSKHHFLLLQLYNLRAALNQFLDLVFRLSIKAS